MNRLNRYISSRRHGGSFFTMVIFVMMLVSTALMYYYFQRARYLERELTALRSGEETPRSGLLSMLPWGKNDSPAPVTTSAPIAPPAESQPEYATPATTPAPQPALRESTATTAEFQEHSALDSLDMTETAEDLEAPSTDEAEDTLTAEQEAALEESGETESTESAEQGQPIESLYDQMPPPVRVRSPRRD